MRRWFRGLNPVWGVLLLVVLLPGQALAGAPGGDPKGWEALLSWRPGLDADADLRQWLAGEYDYVRTYRLLDRAYARLRAGDLDGAAADFEELLALHPGHPQLPLYLADLQLLRGNRPRAIQILEEHLARHPGSGYAAASLGYLYLAQGQREAAADHLGRAVQAYGPGPEARAVRANLAELAYAAGNYRGALELYRGLRAELPGDPLLTYRTGLAQRHLGLSAEAAESFRAALADPGLDGETDVRARLELAQALRESGALAEATRVLEGVLADGGPGTVGFLAETRKQLYVLYLEGGDCSRALGLYPELADAELPPSTRAAAGYCAMRRSQPERAGQIFRRVLAEGGLAPGEAARVRLELAGLYAQQGDQAGAARTLEQLLADPGVEPALARRGTLQLAELRVALEQTTAARHLLDRLSAGAAEEYTALRVYQLYHDLGFPSDAREHLRRLAARRDSSPVLRARAEQELAFALLREGDDAGAAEVLQRLVARPGLGAPARTRAMRALAEAVARTGPADEARRWARETWELAPDPALGLLLAGLEQRLGDVAAAEAHLTAVRRDPTAPEPLRTRATTELGTLYLEQDRVIEAEEAFWGVLDADPRNRYALASLMELAKRRGDGEDYLVLSDQLRRFDRDAVADAEVAVTAAELGEHRRALEMYQGLLAEETDPEVRARILRRMGYSALRLGDQPAAVGYLQEYLAVASEPDPQALEQLALIHIFAGDCAGALGPLGELAGLRAEFEDALGAARCEEQVGNLGRAAAGYQRALDLRYDADAALSLAWVQQREGRPAAAVATLEELSQRPEVSADARFEALVSLAGLYGERGAAGSRDAAARGAVAVMPEGVPAERALYVLVLGAPDDPRLQGHQRRIRELGDAEERQAQALRLSALYEMAGQPSPALEWAALAVAAKPTALARYRRGVLLYQSGRFDAARGDFDAARHTHPEAALYLAYVHHHRGRSGLAIDVLEAALGREGNPADLIVRMRRQLAHLYLAEGRPAQALAASEGAGAEDADLAQVRARSLLLLGRDEEALVQARRAQALLPPEQQAPVHLLLGDIYRRQERWQDADREYARYLLRYPDSAAVLHAAADCRSRAGDHEGSLQLLRRAVKADPGQPSYLLDYGYALAQAGETEQAHQVFDTYLVSFPESVAVLEESGYLNLRGGRNDAAAERFRAAIDQLRLRASHTGDAAEARRQQKHVEGLKRTLWDLEKRFSLAGYVTRSDLGGSGATVGYRGIVPGQLGLEAGWRPPRIGFWNHRIFEVTARVLGSFEPDTWSYDSQSTQLALGAKVKPLSGVNFTVGLERLIEIGANSEDNWLLRGTAGHSWGRQLPFPPGWGHGGSVYAELGRYFQDPRRTAAYFEAREGPRWALSFAWALVPHVVVDGRWDDAPDPGGTYLEGGLGVELLGGWGGTAYRANPWGFSATLQYKVGTFEEAPGEQGGKGYRGPTFGITVRR